MLISQKTAGNNMKQAEGHICSQQRAAQVDLYRPLL